MAKNNLHPRFSILSVEVEEHYLLDLVAFSRKAKNYAMPILWT